MLRTQIHRRQGKSSPHWDSYWKVRHKLIHSLVHKDTIIMTPVIMCIMTLGLVSSKGEMLWNMDSESWKRTSLVERKKFIETVSLELILSSDSWAKDWKDQRCNCNGNKGIILLQHQVSPLNYSLHSEI